MKKNICLLALMSSAVLAGCSAEATSNHEQGMALYNEGKYSQATQYLTAAVAENNSKGIYYVDLGMNYIETGSYGLAKDAFDAAVSIGDEDELAYRGLGIMCVEQGLYADAVGYFDSAIDAIDMEIGALEADILKYRAEALVKSGDYEKALTAYDALIQLGEDEAWNNLCKGNAYLLMGDGTNAVACYDTAIENQNNIEYYVAIYNSFNDLGLYEQGYEYLKKALIVEGDSGTDHLNRGKIYYIMGQYDSAITELSYAYETEAEACEYTAFCYEKQGKLDAAIEAYYASLKLKNDPEVANLLAIDLSENGEDNLAWSLVHTTMEDFPNCDCMQDLKWNEIVLYEKQGMFPSAYTRLLEYLETYPSNATTDKELQFLKAKQSVTDEETESV